MSDTVERICSAIAALSESERRLLFERLGNMGLQRPTTSQTTLPFALELTEPQGPADYHIVFDGGSKGNPGPGYGSYALTRASDGKKELVRLDFGRTTTSNEAEYETLVAALQGLIERLDLAGQSPADATVELRGDSALVIKQVTGEWKTKDDRMRLLRNQCRELLARFGGYRLILHRREESVRVLGH